MHPVSTDKQNLEEKCVCCKNKQGSNYSSTHASRKSPFDSLCLQYTHMKTHRKEIDQKLQTITF